MPDEDKPEDNILSSPKAKLNSLHAKDSCCAVAQMEDMAKRGSRRGFISLYLSIFFNSNNDNKFQSVRICGGEVLECVGSAEERRPGGHSFQQSNGAEQAGQLACCAIKKLRPLHPVSPRVQLVPTQGAPGVGVQSILEGFLSEVTTVSFVCSVKEVTLFSIMRHNWGEESEKCNSLVSLCYFILC